MPVFKGGARIVEGLFGDWGQEPPLQMSWNHGTGPWHQLFSEPTAPGDKDRPKERSSMTLGLPSQGPCQAGQSTLSPPSLHMQEQPSITGFLKNQRLNPGPPSQTDLRSQG